jgi:hypothetical protein
MLVYPAMMMDSITCHGAAYVTAFLMFMCIRCSVSRDGSVGTVSKLQAGRTRNLGSTSDVDKRSTVF